MTRTVAERKDVLPALAEVFREHGYEGATLSLITEGTGLGKGSLYHFFPGGKEEMAEAVLDEIGHWFEASVFTPLAEADPPSVGVSRMFETVDAYFASGKRICLVGAFALSNTRDRFAIRLRDYFLRWRYVLEQALRRAGVSTAQAASLSEDVVLRIQGALVLARALDDPYVFRRSLARSGRDVREAFGAAAFRGQ